MLSRPSGGYLHTIRQTTGGLYLLCCWLLAVAPPNTAPVDRAAPAAEYFYDFTPEARAIYASVMSLELDRAQTEIAGLRGRQPRNLAADHLESYLDFFRLYLTGDERLSPQLDDRYADRLDRLERGDPTSPYYNYALAEARLHRSLIELRFERHLAAFRELNRAHKLLRNNARDFPDFLLTYKDLGLLHAAVGSIPPQYKWGVELLSSLNGTIAEGRRELRLALQETDSPFHLETQVLSAFLELHLANRPAAAYNKVNDLPLRPATNPLHCFVLANLSMHYGRNDRAIELLQRQPRGGTAADFPYLDFMLAQARLRRLEPGARLHYQSFLLRYPGRHFREEALQKIGWTYLLEDNTAAYARVMTQISGGSRSGGDQNAVREAAALRPPHGGLLRARLLFDGAYLARARALLEGIDPKLLTTDEQLELTYRTGRVLGGLEDTDGALAFYRRTIDRGRDNPAFFACNAALQAGLLEEARGRTDSARAYFRECLDLHPAEYKTGLHLLAKAGLDRL